MRLDGSKWPVGIALHCTELELAGAFVGQHGLKFQGSIVPCFRTEWTGAY